VIVLVAGEAATFDAGSLTVGRPSARPDWVVRTLRASSVPAALSAAAAFTSSVHDDRNLHDMQEAMDAVSTGDVVQVRGGVWIGRVQGQEVARNGSAATCADAVVRLLLARVDAAEVVTVVSGPGGEDADLLQVVHHVAEGHDGVRVQAFVGGPRGPALAVGVE
jgi:dihydroxyacetone kinase-like predicted kinase